MKLRVKIKRLNESVKLSKYAKLGDAGFDLVTAEDTIIWPGETKIVPTGLAFEIPPGYELQVRPRSGMTRNAQGVIAPIETAHFVEVDELLESERGNRGFESTEIK
ncbi:dUTP diphosphatase [Bacillus proteolyticus]|uniref:dUTP diphosphatase n=1 Tax=Bacillus proteolyticus TaxID=2026192 RepID=UPI003CFC822F